MQTFIKENTKEVLFILSDAFLLFFISGNLYLSAFVTLVSAVVSLYLVNLLYQDRQKKEKEVAILSYLSSLLECLQEGKTMSEAFSLSEHYLSGYIDPLTYDDFLESDGASLPCPEYSFLLSYVISKEKKGEVHLANYFQIIQSIDDKIHLIQTRMLSTEKETDEAILKVILVTMTLSLLCVLIPTLPQGFTLMDQIIVSLSVGAMLPSVFLVKRFNLQEESHVQN